MTSKSGNKLLTELLNIEGVKVISKRQYEGIGIILQIESFNQESICSICGTKSHRLHQNHRSLINPLLSNWVETLIFRRLKQRKFVKFSESDRRGLKIYHSVVSQYTRVSASQTLLTGGS
jgi:transposase